MDAEGGHELPVLDQPHPDESRDPSLVESRPVSVVEPRVCAPVPHHVRLAAPVGSDELAAPNRRWVLTDY